MSSFSVMSEYIIGIRCCGNGDRQTNSMTELNGVVLQSVSLKNEHLMSIYSTYSDLSATLPTSLSQALFLFLYFLFYPHRSKQMSAPWRPALPQVSSYRGGTRLTLDQGWAII